MLTTIRARFDGEVFRPEQPVELRADTSYVLIIAEDRAVAEGAVANMDEDAAGAEAEYPLTQLGRLATDMGVDDLAARHDWYAHGKIEP